MAKILISPLGVGGRSKDGNSLDREYQEANYRIDGKEYQSRFMASALYKHFQLDGIIFIGTVKSMWEEVYRFFCERNKQTLDQDYWLDLATKIDLLNHQSSLKELDLSSVKNLLGDRSECILIKYGLDEGELWQNLDQVFRVVSLLKRGDEIYIDITHSFRSLSLFLFLILTFLKDLPQTEDIKISGVYYGMLDISREMGYTPVIDLKSLFNMTDWIKASYILNHYGDGNLVARLLEEQGENQVADQICKLSSSININYLPAIRQNVKPLKTSLNNLAIPGPFKYIKDTLIQFVKKISNQSGNESDFQLKLAGWYFENDRYATGYITLTEAIITYLCEIRERDIENQQHRESVKDLLFKGDLRDSELASLYKKVNSIRKQVAHASLEENRESYLDAVNNASKYHQQVTKIFRSGSWGS